MSEGVAEVETYPKADRNRNRGNQQNVCLCHLLFLLFEQGIIWTARTRIKHPLFTFTFDLHLETDEGSFSEMEPHEGDAARVLLRRADREAEAAQARNDDLCEVRRFRNAI